MNKYVNLLQLIISRPSTTINTVVKMYLSIKL